MLVVIFPTITDEKFIVTQHHFKNLFQPYEQYKIYKSRPHQIHKFLPPTQQKNKYLCENGASMKYLAFQLKISHNNT